MTNRQFQLARLRLKRLHQLARNAGGQFQSEAERLREEREQRKYGAAGLVAGAGAYAGAKVAASKIGSLNPDGIRKIGDLLKRLPLRGGRILSGGALASALKNLR